MPAPAPITLHVDANHFSPYAMSAYVALVEKGVAFETRTVDLDAGEHRRAAYGATSATGRVPTLDHGGFRLAESSAIDEYVDEAFPGCTRPTCASARWPGRCRRGCAAT